MPAVHSQGRNPHPVDIKVLRELGVAIWIARPSASNGHVQDDMKISVKRSAFIPRLEALRIAAEIARCAATAAVIGRDAGAGQRIVWDSVHLVKHRHSGFAEGCCHKKQLRYALL